MSALPSPARIVRFVGTPTRMGGETNATGAGGGGAGGGAAGGGGSAGRSMGLPQPATRMRASAGMETDLARRNLRCQVLNQLAQGHVVLRLGLHVSNNGRFPGDLIVAEDDDVTGAELIRFA